MSIGKKISELPVATTLTGLELAVVVQTSTTKQSTPEAITASVSSRLDNVVSVNNAALTSINNTVSALEIRVSAVSARASVNAAAITSINAEVSLKAYRDGDFLTNIQYIEFNTTTSYAPTPGRLTWDIESGTLDLGLTGTVNLLIGQRTVAQVYNNSGVTLPRGKAVRVTGAQGQRLTGALALADSDANSLTIFGIMLETVSVNRSGYVATDGLVKNLNTVGYNDGDIVYLSPISAGELTPIKPVSPQHLVQMGYIVNGGTAGAGEIYIKVQNGYELGELHDVKVSASTSLADGEVLAYNVSAQVWTNSSALIETQASVSALNIQVAAVSALTSINAAAITSVNNVVSALEVRVSNASATNTTQTAAITSINNVVSALEIRVSAASAQAASNAAAITSVNNVVSALEIRVSAVSAQAATNAAAITSINNLVSALEIRVSSVSAAVVSINNVVSVLAGQISAVDTSVINAAFVSINNVVSALEVRVSGVSATTSTLTAAITSVNAVVSLKVNLSGDTMTGNLTVPSINSGPLAGFRNALINGAFNIAQRGTSFAAGANNDDTYNLDRWYVLSDGNDVVDITQSTTEIPANGSQTSIAMDVETTAKKFGIAQIIEQRNCQGLIGNTVTLSFKAKVSSTTKLDNVKCAIVSWSGTADTVTSDIISAWNVEGTNPTLVANATYENTPANLNVTTSWATYSVSAAVDMASTKNIIVFIWSDVTDTTAGDFLYITDVQVEIGSVATPFERRPIGTELALCQRYYQQYQDPPARGVASGATQISRVGFSLPVIMRVAPSGSLSGSLNWFDGTGTVTISAFLNTYSTPHSFEFDATTSSTATYRPIIIYIGGNTGTINLSAEL